MPVPAGWLRQSGGCFLGEQVGELVRKLVRAGRPGWRLRLGVSAGASDLCRSRGLSQGTQDPSGEQAWIGVCLSTAYFSPPWWLMDMRHSHTAVDADEAGDELRLAGPVHGVRGGELIGVGPDGEVGLWVMRGVAAGAGLLGGEARWRRGGGRGVGLHPKGRLVIGFSGMIARCEGVRSGLREREFNEEGRLREYPRRPNGCDVLLCRIMSKESLHKFASTT